MAAGSKKKLNISADLERISSAIGGKVPPQALDVEESVLGAMLLDSTCVDIAMEHLQRDCFYNQDNQRIFEAMEALVKEHSSIDLLTVTNKLKQLKLKENDTEITYLEKVGGTIALARMSEKVGSAAHIEFHVRILKQKAIQRGLIHASYSILNDAFNDSVNVDELMDVSQSRIYDAIQSNDRREVRDIGSIINETINQLQEQQTSNGMSGVPSGFVSLDRITNGWQPSDLIILAARPSVGKTAFSLNLARNAAVNANMPVAFFSLEMSAKQLAKRLMISETGLSADKIKGGLKLEPHEWVQLESKIKGISEAPLYIDDTPGIPLMEFRTKAKNLVKNKGVKLIIVDYLQLVQGPADLRGMREQEVAAVSRTLKATAKELDVPIIALSQLSRNAVQRQGAQGKPQLSDLRESGSIEQDADMVIFIHRPDYVGMSEDPESRERTQVIIAKHRNGATADIDMRFKSEEIKFYEENDALARYAESQQDFISSASTIGGDYGSINGNREFEDGIA